MNWYFAIRKGPYPRAVPQWASFTRSSVTLSSFLADKSVGANFLEVFLWFDTFCARKKTKKTLVRKTGKTLLDLFLLPANFPPPLMKRTTERGSAREWRDSSYICGLSNNAPVTMLPVFEPPRVGPLGVWSPSRMISYKGQEIHYQ